MLLGSSGLFIASIEEGARIFTPVRLLPFEHPDALNHQFPTVLQFHGGEDRLPVTLGRSAGLLLGTTLQRYPMEPDTAWPGLRAVAYLDGFPLAFLVDTRGIRQPGRGCSFTSVLNEGQSRASTDRSRRAMPSH